MKKYDVVALGELLIDFTENGKSNQGNPIFEANPGGAPCNVLAMLAKLGHNTAFIGKVGNDFFGDQLRAAMMLNKTEISEDILKETEMLNFANVAASIITTRKGALRVMPEQEEIQQYLKIIRNANK